MGRNLRDPTQTDWCFCRSFPIPTIGCDGGYTELEVGCYQRLSHFRWWSVPPDGWDVLDEIAGKIIKKIDSL